MRRVISLGFCGMIPGSSGIVLGAMVGTVETVFWGGAGIAGVSWVKLQTSMSSILLLALTLKIFSINFVMVEGS